MKTKNLIIPTLFAVLASSCYNEKIKHYDLTEVDLKMVPYVLGQNVSFVDVWGQSFDVTVTKDSIWQHYEYEFHEYCKSLSLQSTTPFFYVQLIIHPRYRYVEVIIYRSVSGGLPSYLWYNEKGNYIMYDKNQNFYDSLEINS